MAVTYKDISLLTQKASVAGNEKIAVSEINYITPQQIADFVPVDSVLSSSSQNAIQNKVVYSEFNKVAYLGSTEGEVEMVIPDTIEAIMMNGSQVPVSNGAANLGTVLTEHQSLVGLASEDYVDNAVATALGDVETLLAALL